jgi:lipid-A-disaccharide synthase
MLIAGEASGDLLAAELVSALRENLAANPPSAIRHRQFFGAGGPKMSAAGVELAFDLTQHSVIGITDVLKNILKFRRLFKQLLALAIERKPDVVIGVDYGGFNLRFGAAVKKYVRENPFSNWDPKIVQFVSPQVWASRPGRADKLARDYDLLLSIFPFEKDWYAKRVPQFRVEFVGHPMLERMQKSEVRSQKSEASAASPMILLLPGSRRGELQRHLPVMLDALKLIQKIIPAAKAKMVLPNENLAPIIFWEFAKKLAIAFRLSGPPTLESAQGIAKRFSPNLEIQVGNLPNALAQSDVALASTGTVTMECAFFGVPTVTLYKTSWLTYQIARRIVTVKSLTMPNLLAGETVYPEFIQNEATSENLSRAAVELLQDESRRKQIKGQLAKIISSLGAPGAAGRAAKAVLSLFP